MKSTLFTAERSLLDAAVVSVRAGRRQGVYKAYPSGALALLAGTDVVPPAGAPGRDAVQAMALATLGDGYERTLRVA